MPRKAGTAKRALDGLTLQQKRRRLLYGDFADIAGILDAVRLVRVSKGPTRDKALRFLGDWLCRADPVAIELFARWKRTADHARQPVDWLHHLLIFGIRVATPGKTWKDALRDTPTEHLVAVLAANGCTVDGATIRKALLSLGVKKPPGRPRGNREIAG